ncbi:uncharacterized protein VTP21DRAFT_2505 [Calcarisporiella thermophila]|uniref:uncharacterized protein n=1 Tax=Calcarisporiella thermophila TaxID=911321 RepID=UPI003742F0F4
MMLWFNRKVVPYMRLNGAGRRQGCFSFLKYFIVVFVVSVIIFFSLFGVNISLSVYYRNHAETDGDGELYCKHTAPYPPTHYDITPGIQLDRDWNCYDFAATLQNHPDIPREDVIYHAYWRSDLRSIGEKQVATLRSYFATQNHTRSTLYLWSNGDLSDDPVLAPLRERFGERFQLKLFDAKREAVGTPLEGSPNLEVQDHFAYLDGDLVRLLVLYRYGGVWFDMDSLFVRDMGPLLEHEWVGMWDCFLPEPYPFNGAFMRFRRSSPYLCEMLSEIAHGPKPRENSVDLGTYLYYRIYHRLLRHGVRPFKIIPWCFTDPSVCRPQNSMPSAFSEDAFDEARLQQTFAFHWHNQWDKAPGRLFRFLVQLHDRVLDRA